MALRIRVDGRGGWRRFRMLPVRYCRRFRRLTSVRYSAKARKLYSSQARALGSFTALALLSCALRPMASAIAACISVSRLEGYTTA